MDSGKPDNKSKEEIRRMMRLTAAKMQSKKPPTSADGATVTGSALSDIAASSTSSSQTEHGSRDDNDYVKGHPFARYNSLNQLTCILCGCPVKSSLLWRAHLISRIHRANAEALRSKGGDRAVDILSGAGVKRRLLEAAANERRQKSGLGLTYSDDEEEADGVDEIAAKKPRQSAPAPALAGSRRPQALQMQQDSKKQKQQQLPEGFFDDPVADARARHVPYKDRMEEELELFTKEMRDTQVESDRIAEAAEEEADNVRYLEEIIAQEETWHRLNELELLKEAANIKQEAKAAMKQEVADDDVTDADADAEDTELDIGPDAWRRKKL